MGAAIRGVLRSAVRSIVLIIFMLSVSVPSLSRATEPLSIQTLLAQATTYELRVVLLHGLVRSMQVVPPFFAMMHEAGCLLYGQATFVLEDETGALPVEVFGSCSPQSPTALPKDGDEVVLSAVIHISNREMPAKVWAQATELRLHRDTIK